MNYGSGMGIPVTGYGVCGFGYDMGKSHPRYTRVQPYTCSRLWILNIIEISYIIRIMLVDEVMESSKRWGQTSL